jgi:anti-sigma-K factor RskA
MLSNHNDSTMIQHYLLGKLADAERDRFEERLFADDELLGELLATEDELIESAIAGELHQDDAESFLVTPERRQQLRFRKALQRTAKLELQPVVAMEDYRSVGYGWMNWATASIAALFIIGVVIWIAPWSQGRAVELTLTAGSSEREVGRAPDRIKLPGTRDTLKLHLVLPQSQVTASDYRVVMITEDGKPRSLTPVSHNRQFVDLAIPAADLLRRTYTFIVYAVKPDGTEERLPGNYQMALD